MKNPTLQVIVIPTHSFLAQRDHPLLKKISLVKRTGHEGVGVKFVAEKLNGKHNTGDKQSMEVVGI